MKYNIEQDYKALAEMFPTVSKVFDPEFLSGLSSGKTMLNKEEFCIKTGYNMRPLKEQFFESHRKYIDIHITLEGSEMFAVNDIDKLTANTSYDVDGDCILYDKCGPLDKLVSSRKNDVVVFDVEDGHMTAIGDEADEIEKVIVKVLVENISI